MINYDQVVQDEGASDYRNGKPRESNPYPNSDPHDRRIWFEGYDLAKDCGPGPGPTEPSMT